MSNFKKLASDVDKLVEELDLNFDDDDDNHHESKINFKNNKSKINNNYITNPILNNSSALNNKTTTPIITPITATSYPKFNTSVISSAKNNDLIDDIDDIDDFCNNLSIMRNKLTDKTTLIDNPSTYNKAQSSSPTSNHNIPATPKKYDYILILLSFY